MTATPVRGLRVVEELAPADSNAPGRLSLFIEGRRVWRVVVLHTGPDVSMVLDALGKLWICLNYPAIPGEVIRKSITYDTAPNRSLSEDLSDPSPFCVIAQADMREVRAAYAKANNPAPLKKGYWYEAHAD